MFSTNIKRAYLFKFLVQFSLVGGVLIPFFTDWGGLTLAQTLLLQSWFLVWTFLLEIPTGAVADYIGRKQSLYLGALINTIAVLVYVSTPSLPIFLLAEFMWAAALALYSGADEAFIFDSLKTEGREKEMGKTIARFESAGLTALMVSAPIGSIIGSLSGPRYSMMLGAIPLTLAFFVGLTFREPPKEKSEESKRYIDILRKGIEIIKGRRKIQWIAIDLAVVHSLTFLMIWLYQPLLMSFGVDIAWFGIVAAAITGAQIIIMNNYHRIEKKIGGVNKLLGITALLSGLLFIIAGSAKLLPIAIVAIVLSLGFGLTRRPLVSTELNQMIPSAQRATILSTIMILRRMFSAGLNPIVGKLADWSLSYTFIIIGITLLVFSGFRQTLLITYQKRINKG